MITHNLIRTVIICGVLSLCSCSGGGGSDSGGGNNGGSRPETGIRVIHAGIDSAPFDFFIPANGTSAVGRASFSRSTGYFPLSNESQPISLSKANIPENVVFSDTVTFATGTVRSLLIYGDHATTGVNETYIEDVLPDFDPTQAAVRFIHAVVGASSITASVGGTVIGEAIPFGTASSYGVVPGGALLARATRNADGALLLAATYTLEAGKIYTVVASGETGYLVVGELLTD